jgi:hypothetical protein
MQPEAGREAKKMRYVGVDIGKWRCRAALMDPEGTVIDEFAFNNDADGIHDLASRLTTEDRVVMESTGSVWTNLYDALDERKVPVVLANPLKTRAIASARIKTDNHNEPYISISSPSLSFHLSFSRGWHTTIRGSTPSSTIRPYEAHPYSSFGDEPQSVFQGDSSS